MIAIEIIKFEKQSFVVELEFLPMLGISGQKFYTKQYDWKFHQFKKEYTSTCIKYNLKNQNKTPNAKS